MAIDEAPPRRPRLRVRLTEKSDNLILMMFPGVVEVPKYANPPDGSMAADAIEPRFGAIEAISVMLLRSIFTIWPENVPKYALCPIGSNAAAAAPFCPALKVVFAVSAKFESWILNTIAGL